MALLGDHGRSASVTAILPVTLLRLTRKDVLALGDEFPEITDQLHQVLWERRQELSGLG